MSNIKPSTVKQATQLQSILNRLIQPKELKKHPLVVSEIKFLIESVKKQLKAVDAKALLRVPEVGLKEKVVFCGDTHGQYRDVLRLFDLNGWPPKSWYIFLGDYVDRGPRSIEVICLIFALRLTFPNRFFALRGNHEATEINKFYGFHDEIRTRFGKDDGPELFKSFNQAFTYMPLAAVYGGRIFCMHGGIPKKQMSTNMTELEEIKMPIESPRGNEFASDLLWSDPSEDVDEFVDNPRGLGHQFGVKQVNEFLKRHELDLICRAHQVFPDGYKFFGANQQLITVFSAPNYGGEFNNSAASVTIEDGVCKLSVLKPFHRGK